VRQTRLGAIRAGLVFSGLWQSHGLMLGLIQK